MKRILVPTDFSPNAAKAVYFAAEIAKAAGGRISLLHVNDVVDIPFRVKTAIETKYDLPADAAIQKELETIQKNIQESHGVDVSMLCSGGTVVSSIMDAVADTDADLIVMGTVGDTSFKEKLIGSITASVIGTAKIPVLAVPLLSEWSDPKNILVAVNHFDEQIGLAKPAFDLAALFKSKITTAIFTDEDTAVAVDYVENTRSLKLYESELKTEYSDAWLETAMLDGHEFQETLDNYIDENYVDILVMFTHHRNIIQSLFHKSLTKRMSYHTNIPLLAIPVL